MGRFCGSKFYCLFTLGGNPQPLQEWYQNEIAHSTNRKPGLDLGGIATHRNLWSALWNWVWDFFFRWGLAAWVSKGRSPVVIHHPASQRIHIYIAGISRIRTVYQSSLEFRKTWHGSFWKIDGKEPTNASFPFTFAMKSAVSKCRAYTGSSCCWRFVWQRTFLLAENVMGLLEQP